MGVGIGCVINGAGHGEVDGGGVNGVGGRDGDDGDSDGW